MKIAFVLEMHEPDDGLFWYSQVQSLKKLHDNEILYISAQPKEMIIEPEVISFDRNKLTKKKLITLFMEKLIEFGPDIVICDSPISIFAAQLSKFKLKKTVKIIYYVTEWYPSKKNLRNSVWYIKPFKAMTLVVLSLIASFFVSGFMFGEYYKSLPFRFLFFLKKYIYLSYYPNLKYIKSYLIHNINKECKLFYSGPSTAEKGFEYVLSVAEKCAMLLPKTQFTLRLICEPNVDFNNKKMPENLKIHLSNYQLYSDFCNTFGEFDIYLDLRKTDIENTHCLPVKLFYYMAAGRPVIYSDLKSIRKEVPEIKEFGHTVTPKDIDNIVKSISNYIQNEQLYKQHCQKAKELAIEKYNWEKIEKDFLNFIQL